MHRSLVLIFFGFFLVSCDPPAPLVKMSEPVSGSGTVVSETREVSAFDSLILNTAICLNIHQDEGFVLNFTGEDNILPLIETEVVDGTLIVRTISGYKANSGVQLDVMVPFVHKIVLNGGGGVCLGDLDAEELIVIVNGGGNISGRGRVGELVLEINGAGTVNLHSLESDNCVVRLTGAADTNVFVRSNLKAEIFGSGNIIYYGEPEVECDVVGTGSVTRESRK